jgi:hypothetical protein
MSCETRKSRHCAGLILLLVAACASPPWHESISSDLSAAIGRSDWEGAAQAHARRADGWFARVSTAPISADFAANDYVFAHNFYLKAGNLKEAVKVLLHCVHTLTPLASGEQCEGPLAALIDTHASRETAGREKLARETRSQQRAALLAPARRNQGDGQSNRPLKYRSTPPARKARMAMSIDER